MPRIARRASLRNNVTANVANGSDDATAGLERPSINVGEPISIDPASYSGGDGTGSADTGNDTSGSGTAARRGRKPRAPSKGTPLDVNIFAATLQSVHMMLAALTKSPGIIIDGEEAKLLSQSVANVARHYDIEATAKSLDWANLVAAAGMIYGTRIMASSLARQTAKSEKDKAAAATVVQPPAGPSNVIIPGVGTFDPHRGSIL